MLAHMPSHVIECMPTSIQCTSYIPKLVHENICRCPCANMPTCLCDSMPHACTPTCLYMCMNICLLLYNVHHIYQHFYRKTFVHAHVPTCLHANVLAGLHVFMQACPLESTCERIRANKKKCPNVSMSTCIHVYVCPCSFCPSKNVHISTFL